MSKNAAELFDQLLANASTLHIASLAETGKPNISYSPFIRDEHGNFYIFISQLASHTRDLIAHPHAAIMLVEDEQDSRQIFARTRVTYDCDVAIVETSDQNYPLLLDQLQQRFGSVVELLRGLPDFLLFRLTPVQGRFVMGFGQAFDLGGEGLKELIHVGPESAG